MEFYATCPTGFEHILGDELVRLGASHVRPLQGLVAFGETIRDAYAACLWSRLASRVVVVLARGGASEADELYETVHAVPWEDHIPQAASFAVDASGTNAQLRTTQFTALRAKDAIADALLSRTGARPPVNAKSPDVGVVVRVSRERASVGIDLAGAPLFQRGYGHATDQRGLRADYAAALLTVAGWHVLARDHMPLVVDLTRGSGTLAVEAALMASACAPGLVRLRWGFEGWAGHDARLWEGLLDAARESCPQASAARVAVPTSARTASHVRSALRAAGIEPNVTSLGREELSKAGAPSLVVLSMAQLLADDLVRETAELSGLARSVADLGPRRVAVAARDRLAAMFLRREASSSLRTMQGRDDLFLEAFEDAGGDGLPQMEVVPGRSVPVLVSASDQFAARLAKVARQRAKWARANDVTCYRVYDADLPDYAVSLDLYEGTDPATGLPSGRRWLQVAEYAAPKSVDSGLARARLMDALAIAPAILNVAPHNTFLRVRRREKGGSQYAKEGTQGSLQPRRAARGEVPLPPGAHLIDEGGLTFEVNFSSRLDCGIFLDHRETRAMLREMAKQTAGSKRFLNLFAYTGTATCYAADGGMRHTTTVDLSRPSLDWARRNMERNGFAGPEHEYVQADVVRWVGEQRHTRNRWDLVFCDVPTFSNSNRMGRRSFDVQRDHAELLIGVSRLLMRGGVCVFSCNLRTFRPDTQKLARAGVELEDITARTIPEDFARNQRIHHAYLVRRVG